MAEERIQKDEARQYCVLGQAIQAPHRANVYEPATEADDLEKFFVERANGGDVDGLVALYEAHAVLVSSDGKKTAAKVKANVPKTPPVSKPRKQSYVLR